MADWSVVVKVDGETMSEAIFPTYAEALACAQNYEMQGKTYLLVNWDEVGPPEWEVNFMGLEFRIVISEVEE